MKQRRSNLMEREGTRSVLASVISIVIVMSYMFKAEVSVLKPETS